jgi:hypothetical protein
MLHLVFEFTSICNKIYDEWYSLLFNLFIYFKPKGGTRDELYFFLSPVGMSMEAV